jgi:CopG family transcriptional regulator, nickel-responsive regulator
MVCGSHQTDDQKRTEGTRAKGEKHFCVGAKVGKHGRDSARIGDVTRDKLVRFGVAMEAPLLQEFDELVAARGGTRSEALRDLARAAIVKAKTRRGAEAVATLTLVYDHHVRDLMERLTDLQHELGEGIRSTLHVHLDHHHCLEVIVMQGHSERLQTVADQILALKGVKHAGLELYAGLHEAGQGHGHVHHGKSAHHHVSAPPTPPASWNGTRPAKTRSKSNRKAAPKSVTRAK